MLPAWTTHSENCFSFYDATWELNAIIKGYWPGMIEAMPSRIYRARHDTMHGTCMTPYMNNV